MISNFFDTYFNDSALLSEKCARKVRGFFVHSTSVLCDLACEYDADFKAEDFVFTFSDTNERIRREATRELRSLYSNVYSEIRGGVIVEWEMANKMVDDMISTIFEGRIDLGRHHPQRWFARNKEAMDAFFARKSAYGGLNLSQKVWKYTGEFKEEMELALSVSMGEGVPSSKVAKTVQSYLNEPERLFRRVRNEEGNLRLSKKAREYKTGRGVYRSSYRNAMRLARTETNMAFRAADYERQQGLDFVVGQEIRLSNNHTTKLPNGKVVEFTDICDELKGRYPKTFKFVGWHPHCRCHSVPILKTEDEMDEDADRILDGKNPTDKSVNSVDSLPDNFDRWVDDNRDRIDKARERGTEPYFLRHNSDAVNEILKNNDSYFTTLSSDLSERLKPSEIKDVSEVKSVIGNVARNHPEYFKRGFKGVVGVSEDSKYMSTTIDGLIKVNFAEDSSGYNAGDCLVSAIGKIKRKTELSRNEEYAIESMWHEILHNKSANKTVLPSIKDTEGGFTRATAETINQLLARQSYKDFLSEIGGKSMHEEWILRNGHAYNDSVSNLRALLKKAGINDKEFVKRAEIILMQDYTGIDKEIENLLTKMYRGKSDIVYAFRFIEIEPKYYESVLKIFD